MAENTRLILDQERIRELECERDFLQETLKEFQIKNRNLKEEVIDTKH
jgi:hypothetical protein